MPPTAPEIFAPSPFADIEAATGALLLRTSAPLLQMGTQMLVTFAGLVIAWYGIKTMLEGRTPNMADFVRLVISLAFTFSMLRFYYTPLPGLGTTFPGLIVDQANHVARVIEAAAVQQVFEVLDTTYQRMERPHAWALLQTFIYLELLGAMMVAKVVLLAVTASGLVATGICVVLGPLFIPFHVLPHFEWMFWGWLRALLVFAFYRVVAQAMVSLLGSFVIGFCQQFSTGLDTGQQVLYALHFVMVLGAFALGLLLVPLLTAAIFSGSPSGLTSLPRVLAK